MINNTSFFKFDFNYIKDSIVHDATVFASSPQTQRVAKIAIPFLCMCEPVRTTLTLGLGAAKSAQLLHGMYLDPQKRRANAIQLAQVVTGVFLSVYKPAYGIVASSVAEIVKDLQEAYVEIQKSEWQKASFKLFAAAHHILYLGSIVVGGPELKLLSLLAHATVELYTSHQKLKEGQRPEGFANLLLALIRLSQVPAYGRTIHRAYFGKEVTQEQLKEVLAEVQDEMEKEPKKQIDFDQILEKRGFTNKVKNVSFAKAAQEVARERQTAVMETAYQEAMPVSSSSAFQVVVPKGESSFSWSQTLLDMLHSLKKMQELIDKLKRLVMQIFKKIDWKAFFLSDYEGEPGQRMELKDMELINCEFDKDTTYAIRFKGVKLTDCDFSQTNAGSVFFERVGANNCNFSGFSFYKSQIKQSLFMNSNLTDANFAEARLDKVTFARSDLTRTAFNGASLTNVFIDNSRLNETCFLDANVLNSEIYRSDLTDCLFVGTENQFAQSDNTPHIMTRPVIGYIWNFKGVGSFTDASGRALKECNAIVLKIDSHVEGISTEGIDGEVKKGLRDISKQGLPPTAMSICDALLQQAKPGSHIALMKERAQKIASYMHGLFLPGLSEDVKPELYGQKREMNTWPELSYRRSINACALIASAHQKDLPIHGTCHGAQLGNVYFGGTLRSVEGHAGVYHELAIKKGANPVAAQVISSMVHDNIHGLSMHHQANDRIGKGLHTVLEHDGVPKAIVNEKGNIVFTQFHPEFGFAISEDSQLGSYPHYRKAAEQGMRIFSAFVEKAAACLQRSETSPASP